MNNSSYPFDKLYCGIHYPHDLKFQEQKGYWYTFKCGRCKLVYTKTVDEISAEERKLI